MRPFWGTNMLYLLLLGSPHSAIALPAPKMSSQRRFFGRKTEL